MSNPVLLLNQDYSPLSICSMEKAFILVFLNKAELLTAVDGDCIPTVNRQFPMPSVVRLNRYINLPYRGVVLTRHNIFKRDSFSCQYCGSPKDLTLDHVVPRSKGGKTSWTNLVTACQACNAKKGDAKPEEVGLALQYKPFKPSYVMFLRNFSGTIRDEWKPFLGQR
jgi:5-methylcytosine-specific restriction endonuclease McrA